MEPTPKETTEMQYNREDWEEIRLRFFNSLLVDTAIASLIQNLEMEESWPIEGAGEVPSKYIDFTWEEVHELAEIADHPERLDLLISVLQETIAFDDPFGDMVTSVESATESDEGLMRNLEDLNIPADCPLKFSTLTKETLALCKSEGVTTVGGFADFSEKMAQSVIIAGDFQALLNALVAKDVTSIARMLPYRLNENGVFLIEAISLMVGQLTERERNSLLKRYGSQVSTESSSEGLLDEYELADLEEELEQRVRVMAHYFKREIQEITERMKAGTSLERCFVVLNNEAHELIGCKLLGYVLKIHTRKHRPSRPASIKGRGFFARLFSQS